jgi:hypothetical protein
MMNILSSIKVELALFPEGYFRLLHLIANQTVFRKENPNFLT